LTPPVAPAVSWTFATIESFNSQRDGCSPMGALILDKMGDLYGTAAGGGAYAGGTVFALEPSAAEGGAWKGTVLHSFSDGTDGAFLEGGLLRVGRAAYGTTRTTVFQLVR
jgi:uncharacterized repeat protein (TIGR03803 family)